MNARTPILCLLCVSGCLHLHASVATDTIVIRELDEVVVTAKNQSAITDGISCVPTQDEKRHAATTTALLARMMIPGLHVDEMNHKIETSWGKEVKFFINGVEATTLEVKTLRPKEIANIEFLLSPSATQYKGYPAVVNYVLRQKTYGGYIYGYAQQGFSNNYGDYSLVGKIHKNKMTCQILGESYYRNAKNIINRHRIDYNFGNNVLIKK